MTQRILKTLNNITGYATHNTQWATSHKQPLSIPQEGRNSGSKCFECSRLCNLSRNAKVNHILPGGLSILVLSFLGCSYRFTDA